MPILPVQWNSKEWISPKENWEKELILETLHDFPCALDGIFHNCLCHTGLQCSDWGLHTTEQSRMIFFMSFILLRDSRKMFFPFALVFCARPFFILISTFLFGTPWLSSYSLVFNYMSDFPGCSSKFHIYFYWSSSGWVQIISSFIRISLNSNPITQSACKGFCCHLKMT